MCAITSHDEMYTEAGSSGIANSETIRGCALMTETRRTYCGLCHPRCGAQFRLEDGRAVQIEGDSGHPICHCPSVAAEYVTHGGFVTGDRAETKCLVVWGSAPSQSDQLAAARARQRVHITAAVDPRMADVQHGWWFPERLGAAPELFGVFESNANVLCPGPEFCSPEIGSWPHTALLCRVQGGPSLAGSVRCRW